MSKLYFWVKTLLQRGKLWDRMWTIDIKICSNYVGHWYQKFCGVPLKTYCVYIVFNGVRRKSIIERNWRSRLYMPSAAVSPSGQQPCSDPTQPEHPSKLGPEAAVSPSGQHPCSNVWQGHSPSCPAGVWLSGQHPSGVYTHPQPSLLGPRAVVLEKIKMAYIYGGPAPTVLGSTLSFFLEGTVDKEQCLV